MHKWSLLVLVLHRISVYIKSHGVQGLVLRLSVLVEVQILVAGDAADGALVHLNDICDIAQHHWT